MSELSSAADRALGCLEWFANNGFFAPDLDGSIMALREALLKDFNERHMTSINEAQHELG